MTPARQTILIVDDDALVAAGVAAMLELLGLESVHAPTGMEGVELASNGEAAAVILDIDLPDIDGIEVYTRLASVRPSMPVIFSSGDHNRRRVGELLNLPHITYLGKPYSIEELEAALAAVGVTI